MQQSAIENSDTITVNKKELYEIVKLAVYDVLSSLDLITAEELKHRDQALKEMEQGEAVRWDDYIRERGLTV